MTRWLESVYRNAILLLCERCGKNNLHLHQIAGQDGCHCAAAALSIPDSQDRYGTAWPVITERGFKDLRVLLLLNC